MLQLSSLVGLYHLWYIVCLTTFMHIHLVWPNTGTDVLLMQYNTTGYH